MMLLAVPPLSPAAALAAPSQPSAASLSEVARSETGGDDFTLPELAAPGEISVDRVVQRTLLENPEVRASWRAIRAAGLDTREARGNYLPTLDISGGVGVESQSGDGQGSYDIDYYELTLQQMLFDGFETPNRVSRLSHLERQAYFEFMSTSEEVALDAYEAYLDVMRYRHMVALARGNYAQHLTVFDQIEQRTRSGAGRGVDLEQITGRLALAESNLMTVAANLHDVVARYQRIVGELPRRELAPLPELAPLMPESVEAALSGALDANPQIFAALENRLAQEAGQDVQRAAFYPDLSLQASTGSNNQDSAIGERRDQSAVQLVASMNLYRGGSDVAAWRAAGQRREQAYEQQELACYNVRQTAQIAYRDTVRLAEQLRYLDQHRQSVDRVRVPYQQQFDLGQRSLLDLLDNENEYFESSRDYINARYDQQLAYARTLAATGQLLSALDVSHLDTADLVEVVKSEDADADIGCDMESPGGFTLDELTRGLPGAGAEVDGTGRTGAPQGNWPTTGSFDVLDP